jgi:hypothetical protein
MTDDCANWRTVIVVCPSTTALVGSSTRRVVKVRVPISFFLRILDHFVGFNFQAAQRLLRLGMFGVCLQVLSDLGGCGATDTQLPRHLRGRLPLAHRPDKQHRLFWAKAAPPQTPFHCTDCRPPGTPCSGTRPARCASFAETNSPAQSLPHNGDISSLLDENIVLYSRGMPRDP